MFKRERARELDRERARGRARGRARDRERVRNRERAWERGRERSRSRDRDRSWERGRERERDRTLQESANADRAAVSCPLRRLAHLLDPPYPKQQGSKKSRSDNIYATDRTDKSTIEIRDEVLAWCREHGPDPRFRVCVASYVGDGYESLETEGWSVHAWKAHGGYGNRSKTGSGRSNSHRERLWFSPHCVGQQSMFEDVPGGQR